MKILDVHSHWGTKRGYPLRTEAELALQKKVWNSEPRYHTEEEMADYFRAQGVKVILDLGFTKNLPLDEVRAFHDYALDVQARHSDTIFGLPPKTDFSDHRARGTSAITPSQRERP